MYKEVLPNELAMNIVGDSYREDCTYTLLSDPDKFVVSVTDSQGVIVDEIELKHDYELLEDEEDDIFKTTREERNYKIDTVRSVLTDIACITFLLLGVGVTLLFLKLGGVL